MTDDDGEDGEPELRGLDPEALLRGALEGEDEDPEEEARLRERIARHLPDLEILSRLGRGGAGAVWRARQKSLDRVVALKVLAPRGEAPADLAERFEREARVLAKLVHSGIVAVHAYGREGDFCWLLMECVEGTTLRELLRSGALAPARALELAGELCAALQFAHGQGVVHRDIKPENVLIDGGGRAKIADFGLAKLLGEPALLVSLTATRQVLGTLRYMAPEQLDRPLEVDHRADLYALGVVIYEMLTGEVPMGRFELPSARLRTPLRLDRVIERSLQREPARRYQQAGEIGSDVAEVREGLGREKHSSSARLRQRATLHARCARWAMVPLLATVAVFDVAGIVGPALDARVVRAEAASEELSTPMQLALDLKEQIERSFLELIYLAGIPILLCAVAACVLGWLGLAWRHRDPGLRSRTRLFCYAAWQLPWHFAWMSLNRPVHILVVGPRASSALEVLAIDALWIAGWIAIAESYRRWIAAAKAAPQS